MHNPKSVRKNETQKLLWDFTLNLSHTIRSVDSQQKKCRIVNFAVTVDIRVKHFKSEKRDKHLEIAGELKQTMEHEGDGDTTCKLMHLEQSPYVSKSDWKT